MTSSRSCARGLSLIELLVAVTLGLVLIAGLIQVFMGNRSTQRVELSLARIQESGRLALDLMTQDLRKAGFHGCAVPIRGLDAASDAEASDFPSWFHVQVAGFGHISQNFSENSVRGFQRLAAGGWSPALAADVAGLSGLASPPREGSDVLALYFGEDTGARLSGAATGAADVPVTWNNACVEQNEIAIVSNCISADMIQVTNAPNCGAAGDSLDYAGTLTGSYSTDDFVLQYSERQYYVADTGRDNGVGDNIFALYRRTNGLAPEELIEGVEFMRILYGQKLPNNSIRFVTPDDPDLDLSEVVSVRLALLVAGSEPSRDDNDTGTYTLLDRDIGPATAIPHDGNRKMRRVFSSTIELRNRLQL